MAEFFDLESLIDEFRDEARDQIDQLDGGLLAMERGEALTADNRTALLRSLHTLKGNAGMLGLSAIRDFVHTLESVMKGDRAEWDPALLERLFEGAAALRRGVDTAGSAGESEAFEELTAARRRLEAAGEGDGEAAAGGAGDVADGGAVRTAAEDRLRVPFAKLDSLLNEVGELVAEAESLVDGVSNAPRAVALDRAALLRRRADRLHDAVMSLRLVPLGRVLNRFHGLVRRLARDQGKEARLLVEGEGTELDKSTADGLAEPLLHLVRNAIDHGIETPDVRERAGKARHGTLRMIAEREGDRVRIQVEDDGRGLDLDAVRDRARVTGVVSANADVSDAEAEELIFASGLSTRTGADTVSGRGLGLDVVRRSVQALRGELHLERLNAGGTRFTLTLPLAVAVVPSLVFEAGGEVLAVPATAVARTLVMDRTERVGVTEVVRDGDRLVPVVDPDRLFRWPSVPRGGYGILLRWGRGGALVTADRLVQQRDLVVKAMPTYGGRPAGVSGASVLAGGKVILMLDPAAVIGLAGRGGEEAMA